MIWAAIWFLFLAIGATLELVALQSRQSGDTLSEQHWRMRLRKHWWNALIAAFLLWLLWHLVFEPVWLALEVWWDDLFTIGIGATLGKLFGERRHPGKKQL